MGNLIIALKEIMHAIGYAEDKNKKSKAIMELCLGKYYMSRRIPMQDILHLCWYIMCWMPKKLTYTHNAATETPLQKYTLFPGNFLKLPKFNPGEKIVTEQTYHKQRWK